MAELLRGYLRASHQHRPIIPVWLPGRAARAFRAGANLTPERAVDMSAAGGTWEEFLAHRLSPSEEFLADRVRSSSDSRSSLP